MVISAQASASWRRLWHFWQLLSVLLQPFWRPVCLQQPRFWPGTCGAAFAAPVIFTSCAVATKAKANELTTNANNFFMIFSPVL